MEEKNQENEVTDVNEVVEDSDDESTDIGDMTYSQTKEMHDLCFAERRVPLTRQQKKRNIKYTIKKWKMEALLMKTPLFFHIRSKQDPLAPRREFFERMALKLNEQQYFTVFCNHFVTNRPCFSLSIDPISTEASKE